MEQIITKDQIDMLKGNKSAGSMNTYCNAIRSLNKSMGWVKAGGEQTVIYYDRMNDQADQIYRMAVCGEGWRECLGKPFTFKNKIAPFTTLMRAYDNSDFSHKKDERFITLVERITERTLPPDQEPRSRSESPPPEPCFVPNARWEVTLPRLKELAKNDDAVGRIALVYSYGYVLRIGELHRTKFVDDPLYNFLDLSNCVWTVRYFKGDKDHLPIRRPFKVFDVDQELCDILMAYYDNDDNPFLIHKSFGDPYDSHKMPTSWPLQNCQELRRSYETWNINDSGRQASEIREWNRILGHTPYTVSKYYNRPEEFTESEPEPMSESDPDPDTEPEPEPKPVPLILPEPLVNRLMALILDPINKVQDYKYHISRTDGINKVCLEFTYQ